jgi:hypothetical protein
MKYIYTCDGSIVKIDSIDAFEVDYIKVPCGNNKFTELTGIVGVKYFGIETIDELKEVEGIESKRKFMVTSYEDPNKFDSQSFLMKFMKMVKNMEDGSVIECICNDSNELEIRIW